MGSFNDKFLQTFSGEPGRRALSRAALFDTAIVSGMVAISESLLPTRAKGALSGLFPMVFIISAMTDVRLGGLALAALIISGILSWLIKTTPIARRRSGAVKARECEQRRIELDSQLTERAARAECERLITELETERARLKAIVENIPAGVIMAEAPGGRVVMVNPQVKQILGRTVGPSPDIESYREWLTYEVNNRPVQGHESVLARTLQGEDMPSREMLYHRGDGKKSWIRVLGASIRDANDSIVGGVDLITDINEEKTSREALRINQERFALAQKAAQLGSFEWNIQTDEVIWFAETEALYGVRPGGFSGGYDAWAQLVHPEDRPGAEEAVRRALADGGQYSAEYRVIWPDGGVHWLQSRGEVFFDAAGRPLRLIGVDIDITDRKRADEELRESEQLLEIALGAAKMGRIHMDFRTNEVISSATGKANFGLGPDDLFTLEYLKEAIHPDDRERVHESFWRAVRNREVYGLEHRVIWPDGSLHWMAAHGRSAYGPDGQPFYFDGVLLDFTERKRMEESLRRQTEALREADHRKDDFLATLSHELRNPLASLSNAVRILSLRNDDPVVVTQTNELLERQVQQMVRMVDDLLEVSRIGRGKIGLQKTIVDLAQVVATAVETSRPLIEAHRHTLTVSLPVRPVSLEADAARLAQVLSNLLNNAAKYTEDGGRIELIAERVNEEVALRVRDNGVGIAPETLPEIFDMFMQVESSTHRSQGGLGIGLTLVRRLVEMHGGKIEAHSEGMGKGSEFLVRLPALAEPSFDFVQKPQEDSYAQAPNGARRVLIVDDNADSAESMAVLLRLRGHEVRLAYDGESALEEAHAFRPDVMFLDLDLPKVDGYEVVRRLRLEPAMRDMTMVAMTGFSQQEDRQRTQEAGFQSHMVKPVDFDKIEELLSSLAHNHSPDK